MNDKTKIGCKRTEPKRYFLKRSQIKPRSKKRIKEEPEYKRISQELKEKAGFKSELSGDAPTSGDWLETHHINGRSGIEYTNPFNLLVCLNSEHQSGEDAIHKHNTYELKQTLSRLVYQIRIEQGYNESDYNKEY